MFRPTFSAHLPDVVPGERADPGQLAPARPPKPSRCWPARRSAARSSSCSAPRWPCWRTPPPSSPRPCWWVGCAPRSGSGTTPAARRPLRREIGEGLGHLWSDRRLRAIAGAAATVNFFGLMIFALLVVFLTRVHDFSPVMIAVVTVAGGLGSLIGALVAPQVADRIGRGRTIVLGSAIFSFGMIAFPAAHGSRWAVLAVLAVNEVVVGIAIMLFDVTIGGFVLGEVPRELLGRVNSSMSTITQGVKALGALTGGALGTAFGLRPALWVAAVGATSTVLWTWFSPLRSTRLTVGAPARGSGRRAAGRAGAGTVVTRATGRRRAEDAGRPVGRRGGGAGRRGPAARAPGRRCPGARGPPTAQRRGQHRDPGRGPRRGRLPAGAQVRPAPAGSHRPSAAARPVPDGRRRRRPVAHQRHRRLAGRLLARPAVAGLRAGRAPAVGPAGRRAAGPARGPAGRHEHPRPRFPDADQLRSWCRARPQPVRRRGHPAVGRGPGVALRAHGGGDPQLGRPAGRGRRSSSTT